MNRIKQLTGNRFGKLIALEPTDRREDNKVIWKCKCDCGNICYIRSTYLVQGWSKSCGCSKYPKLKINGKSKKEFGVSASNQLYSNYKRQAKNRNIVFNITQQKFLSLTLQPCYYCGIYPQQEQKIKGGEWYLYL